MLKGFAFLGFFLISCGEDPLAPPILVSVFPTDSGPGDSNNLDAQNQPVCFAEYEPCGERGVCRVARHGALECVPCGAPGQPCCVSGAACKKHARCGRRWHRTDTGCWSEPVCEQLPKHGRRECDF
jgi:hypothetical protein